MHRFFNDVLHSFFMECSLVIMIFQGSISGSIFDRIFNGKWHQNDLQNRSPGRPLRPKRRPRSTALSRIRPPGAGLFSGIDLSVFFGSLSAPFWARFGPSGSILAPFGSILVTKGALLVNVGPFWLHFGPCWLHVGPFWLHLRPFWLHFGTILDAPG